MHNDNLITLFTPCYNRAHLLTQLYDSLLQQTNKNFEWLIVDDGSTDNSEQVVEAFIAQDKISISYYYKPNGGKHTAINLGVQKAKGNLFFIVDSDDFIANDAIEIIHNQWQIVKDNSKICGILGLSQYTNGTTVGDIFLKEKWEIPFSDYYLKYNLKGDKSVAFKTEILKQYPFPEKNGILFVFEAVVWHEMAKKYNVICFNKVIQYKEYLTEGLSDSSYKMWYVKSLAFSYFNLIENQTYSFSNYRKAYLWNFIHLSVNALLSNESYFYKLSSLKNKLLYLMFFPRGYYSYLRMKKLIIK